MGKTLSKSAWIPLSCAVIVIGANWPHVVQAQSVAQIGSITQPQGSLPAVQVTPDPGFVGTTLVRVTGGAPLTQVRIAWKYVNERMIASLTPIPQFFPIAVNRRISFQPAQSATVLPIPVNPTFQPDAVNEPMVDTSKPLIQAPGN